jgi:hypothetical protein
MMSRNMTARVIASIYFLLGSAAACFLLYLLVSFLWENARKKVLPDLSDLFFLLLLLLPILAIAIIMIIIYRVFFRYSAASLTSLSGLIGVTAYFVANTWLRQPNIYENGHVVLQRLIIDSIPILIGYVVYRTVKFYFLRDFKSAVSR